MCSDRIHSLTNQRSTTLQGCRDINNQTLWEELSSLFLAWSLKTHICYDWLTLNCWFKIIFKSSFNSYEHWVTLYILLNRELNSRLENVVAQNRKFEDVDTKLIINLLRYTVHSAQNTVHSTSTQYTVHSMQYTAYIVHILSYTVHSTQNAVHSPQCAVHSTQYTAQGQFEIVDPKLSINILRYKNSKLIIRNTELTSKLRYSFQN